MPNSIEEDVINNFYKKIQEICNTPIDELIKNRNASKGKNTLVYPEIKGSISELKSMLKYISKEGLEQLPIFRFMELRELINPYLDELHKISIQIKDGKTAEDSQKRNTIAIFLTPNRAGSFVKKRADIWKIIIETNTLLNSSLIDKNKIESMFSVLEGNLKQSNIFKEQIENIFKNFDFLALPSAQLFPFDKNQQFPEKINSFDKSSSKKMTKIPKNYKPTKKEKFMNAKMKEYFRQILINWKDELLKESFQTLNNLQNDENSTKPDLTDRASDEIDRTFELRTRDRERKLINKIEAALKRIEDGTYGYCEETGEPISLKRLQARPVATLSLEAQENHEKAEKRLNS